MYNLGIMWKRYWNGLAKSEKIKVAIGIMIVVISVPIGLASSDTIFGGIFGGILGGFLLVALPFIFFKGLRYFWLNIWLARPFADPAKRKNVRIYIVALFVLIAILRCLNYYQ